MSAPLLQRRPWLAKACLAGVIVVGAALRLADLDGHSLWLDEFYSLRDSRTLGASVSQAYHPPLHVALLHLWSALFDDSLWSLRALSVLFGLLSIPLAYRVSLSLCPGRRGAALVTALGTALLPMAIFVSREGRMYSLWGCCFLLGLWGALGFQRRPVPTGRLVAYLVGLTAGLLTHYYMVVYGAVLAGAALLLAGGPVERSEQRREPSARRLWVKAHLPFVVLPPLLVGWILTRQGLRPGELLTFLYYASHDGQWGVSPATLAHLAWFRNWAMRDQPGAPSLLAHGVLVYLAVGAILLLMWRQGNGSGQRRALALSLVLFLPLLILDGLPIRDYARVLTPTALLLPVLAGQAVAVLPRAVAPRTGTVFARVLTGVFVGGSVATVLPWVPDLYRDEVEPWNSVCARIAGEEQPGDVVLVSADFMTQPLGYCFAGRSPVHGFRDPGGALQRAQERPRAWVLYSHAWKPADADVQQLGVRALVSHGFVVREYWQPGPLIELYLLERRQAAAGIPSG